MIITRTPFRVSFAGGGSDLPSFYRKHPGCVVSVAINRHMYVSVHQYFDGDQFHLKYSKVELADRIEDIHHPIVREAVGLTGVRGGIELTSTADVPAGTGLGSRARLPWACSIRSMPTRAFLCPKNDWPAKPAPSKSRN